MHAAGKETKMKIKLLKVSENATDFLLDRKIEEAFLSAILWTVYILRTFYGILHASSLVGFFLRSLSFCWLSFFGDWRAKEEGRSDTHSQREKKLTPFLYGR